MVEVAIKIIWHRENHSQKVAKAVLNKQMFASQKKGATVQSASLNLKLELSIIKSRRQIT
jgi:hypothetical protein